MILYRGFNFMQAIPPTASTGAVNAFYYGTGSTAQTTREEWFSRTALVTQTDTVDLTDADGYVTDCSLETKYTAYDTIRVTAKATNTSGASIRIREIAIGQGATDLFTREVVDTTLANNKTTGFVFKITYRPAGFLDSWVSA